MSTRNAFWFPCALLVDAILAGLTGGPMSQALAEPPPLPKGLGSPSPDAEPELPVGLGGASPRDAGSQQKGLADFEPLPGWLSGFWDTRYGWRTSTDPNESQTSLAETRLQLAASRLTDRGQLKLVADLVYDAEADDYNIDLYTGQGWIDLREANLSMRPHARIDLKLGRQPLTWGTGDLLFINDLFPKDWRSFFLGRDDNYLKAPSDAIRATLDGDILVLDLVYTPRFDADRYLDGSRVSFFDPLDNGRFGRDHLLYASVPDQWLSDDEFAFRAHGLFSKYELAAYGYLGRWKSPGGFDADNGLWDFPRLNVYGLSAQGPLGSGIANIEAGYYDSLEDSDGDDPLVRNSELRMLVGYQREIAPQLTLGLQYYLEQMLDYSAYLDNLPQGAIAEDKNSDVLTLRLDWLLLNQNLRLSAFTYFSPSDQDGYLRLRVQYRLDDNWQLVGGLNQFFGRYDYTFFGQFDVDSNLFIGARCSFGGIN